MDRSYFRYFFQGLADDTVVSGAETNCKHLTAKWRERDMLFSLEDWLMIQQALTKPDDILM